MRADLNKTQLLLLLAFGLISFFLSLLFGYKSLPGEPLQQTAAIIGSLLLLAPLLFIYMKRSGRAQHPPLWFVIHALISTLGVALIFVHVAGGYWLSPPGMVLFALCFLLVQGVLARIFLSPRISQLFAGSAASFNFGDSPQIDRQALQDIIDQKITLLKQLDAEANEAVFSPALKHWLSAPILTTKYYWLIEQEYRLVGARQRAGWLLANWRRLHLLMAWVFFLGLLMHVIVVLFFAGYAAGNGEIYWWHIAAWGK